MRKKLFIPEEVIENIYSHINESISLAYDTRFSAEEEEDALTAHIFSKLQTGLRKVLVSDIRSEQTGLWKWSIDYYKFRGRGPNATEKYLGSDGILELSLNRKGFAQTKSVLFQSKFEGEGNDALMEQCIKLSTWREAAFVLQFGKEGFAAISLDDSIRSRGRPSPSDRIDFTKYLKDYFLMCLIGDLDLKYKAPEKKLVWRTVDNERVAVKFRTKHRLGIRVSAPHISLSESMIDKEIRPDEIHYHRMNFEPEDFIPRNFKSEKEKKKAQRDLAKIYHPDLAAKLPDISQDLLKFRMQEINEAYEKLKR